MIMNELLTNNKGITLIALIITIIVLIILAAVSIKAAYDSNFVNISLESTQNYAQSQIDDFNYINNTTTFLEKTVSNLTSAQAEYEKKYK